MERNYKVLIIDDEEGAIENLILCLKRYPFLTVEGTAKNGKSGIKLLDKVHPDLLFLDVELPDMEGMDLLLQIKDTLSWNMKVVFYTAYNKYVIDALRSSAFEFLQKPVDKDELHTVVSRFIENESGSGGERIAQAEVEKPFLIVTPTGDLRFLRASEIGYFRYLSNRKIWEVVLANGHFLPLKRNTKAEQLCSFDPMFVQIHQSYIINMHYLLMVQDNHCVMYPPFDHIDELTVSKKYKKEIMERFCQL